MPTTTTGIATEFIQFSRTSNATGTDSDGKIKWAPHNFLLASEQFNASNWTKTTTTVAANSIAAPNGTTTADTLPAAGANSTTLQSYTSLGVPYTFGVWLRRKTGTGNIQIAADSGTYTTVTITSSWALYTVSQTPAAGTISAGIRIVTSADEVYAWGAHLYRTDLGMQNNTSAYPTYSPTTPKNLLGFTESLTTGWTNTNTTDAIASEINPVGLTGAVDVAATAGNGTLLGSLSLLASPYTFSIWLKRKTGSGTVEITVDGTTYVSAAVTSTWTRFSTTLTPSAGTNTPGIRLVTSGDAVYAWGAQLSDSASLDPYFPSYFTAPTAAAYYGPRRDFDASTLACKGLLVEEARTNLVLNSADFTQASWTKFNLNTSGTPAWSNVAVSPDGTQTAEKLIANTTNAAHWVGGSATITNGVAYTVSAYVKSGADAGDYTFASLYDCNASTYIIVNLTSGAFVSGTASTYAITPVGNGWYRLSVTATASSTTGYARVYLYDGTNTNFVGNDAKGIYAWGVQLELGSFATSYIPTGAATATRNADVATVSTQAFPANNTEGSIVVAYDRIGIKRYSRLFTLGNAAETYQLSGINYDVGNENSYIVSPASSSTKVAGSVPAVGTTNKLGFAFKSGDSAVSLNSAAAVADTLVFTMVNEALYLGIAPVSGQHLNGHIRQITYLPRRLTNAELVTRST